MGAVLDTAVGYEDGGVATAYGAKKGKDIATDFTKRITEDNNVNPDRVRESGAILFHSLIFMLKQ